MHSKLEAWDSAMHTSAKACFTSAAIWLISTSSSPLKHFPYLPIVTNPESNTYIQTVFRMSIKIHQLFTGPLPIFPENFMQIRSEVFPQVANRQTK